MDTKQILQAEIDRLKVEQAPFDYSKEVAAIKSKEAEINALGAQIQEKKYQYTQIQNRIDDLAKAIETIDSLA